VGPWNVYDVLVLLMVSLAASLRALEVLAALLMYDPALDNVGMTA
jgi:hypothetical protein